MDSLRKLNSHYIRSSVFGIEDSLVSTTGLIAGVAVGTTNKNVVILAGIVAIAVEAFSMAAGEFISEETEHDLEPGSKQQKPAVAGLVMFVSYLLAGLIPLLPIIALPLPQALYATIVFAAAGLFVLGLIKGQLTRKTLIRSGIKVLLIGGIATIIGIVVGIFFKV
ncbi:VIT1/CCC1 transporter family protein [Candidatus Saccharibacteria bacterium]|nr:VIT1/CCC1 transporter family protein [Candidatus Saccharibacteria bacterium]